MNGAKTGNDLPPVVAKCREMRTLVQQARAAGRSVGFVPTMGALHAGHLSLVEASRRACDFTVVSIFVNPTQFGPREDFSRYPRTLPDDLKLLAPLGVDAVFAPAAEEMYRPGATTRVEPPAVAAPLEGECRPGHFAGVCTVVLKLFQIVPADVAFFGQKDYQQAKVIAHMAADLDLQPRIEVLSTWRDADGLALSSRNRYLSAAERQTALAVSRSLRGAQKAFAGGERRAAVLAEAMRAVLQQAGITHIDYATVRDAETLAELESISGAAVALVACRVGATRLIDNERLA